jgi:hypothetical protein
MCIKNIKIKGAPGKITSYYLHFSQLAFMSGNTLWKRMGLNSQNKTC